MVTYRPILSTSPAVAAADMVLSDLDQVWEARHRTVTMETVKGGGVIRVCGHVGNLGECRGSFIRARGPFLTPCGAHTVPTEPEHGLPPHGSTITHTLILPMEILSEAYPHPLKPTKLEGGGGNQ